MPPACVDFVLGGGRDVPPAARHQGPTTSGRNTNVLVMVRIAVDQVLWLGLAEGMA